MADQRITIEAEETPPAPAPPSDRTIDMAVEFGRMTAEYQATQRELAEVKANQFQALDLIRNQNEMIQALRSQTNRAEDRAESAQAVAAATAVELEESRNDENADGLLEVTPPVETHIQIDQVPVNTKRNLLSKIIFGP